MSLFSNQPDIIALTDNYLDENTPQNSYPIGNYKQIHKKDISIYYNTQLYITILDILNQPPLSPKSTAIKQRQTQYTR